MAGWALLAIVLYTMVNTSVFRYQRFTLHVARTTSAEMGGDSARQVRALQRFMTPTFVNSIGWLTYVVLAFAFVFSYRTWGWYGAGPMLVWAYVGTSQLARIWPLPSPEVCGRFARSELQRDQQMPHLEPAERSLVQTHLLKQLEIAAA